MFIPFRLTPFFVGMDTFSLILRISSDRATSLCREQCSVCYKFVYKHQPAVVCCLDGNIYHGSCFGFSRDTCFHIQSGSSPDWFCPICSHDIFPFLILVVNGLIMFYVFVLPVVKLGTMLLLNQCSILMKLTLIIT